MSDEVVDLPLLLYHSRLATQASYGKSYDGSCSPNITLILLNYMEI